MPEALTKLADGACPTGGLSTVFTATSKTAIIAIDVSNPTASAQEVQVTLNSRTLFKVELPASGGATWRGPQVAETGHVVQINSDSASCEYNISGVEIT